MYVAGISVEMFTAASTLFFKINFVKKERNNTLLIFCICFSKPLDLSFIKKKFNIYTPDEIQGQKVNPINNAPISHLMTDLESMYNFLSENMF